MNVLASFFSSKRLPAYQLLLFFGVKLCAAFVLFWIYTYYYPDRLTADIFKYFDDAQVIYQRFVDHNYKDYLQMVLGIHNDNAHFNVYYNQMNHWNHHAESQIFSDHHVIIRINALLMLFTMGWYPLHVLFFCILSFIGLMGIYHFFEPMVKNKTLLKLGVFCSPSVLIWSSGILKETIVFFCLGLIFYLLSLLNHPKSWLKHLALTCILCLILLVKAYVALLLLPALLGYIVNERLIGRKMPNVLATYACIYVLALGIVICLWYGWGLIHPLGELSTKQKEFNGLVNNATVVNPVALNEYPSSIAKNIPLSIFNVIFRPLRLQKNLLVSFTAIENWGYIIFFILGLLAMVRDTALFKKHVNLFLFVISFSLSLFSLIGFTTPIIGAISRYRTPGMLLLLLLSFVYISKINSVTDVNESNI